MKPALPGLALALALARAWSLPVMAGETMPAHLTGVWGTAESLDAGTTAQAELYLEADGFGLLIGSSPPGVFTAGPDKGKPVGRITMGLPFRARLEEGTLVVLPFNPGNPDDTGPTTRCRYQAMDAVLHCTTPGHGTLLLKRRSAPMDANMAGLIDEMRIALRAHAGKASALRPAPAPAPARLP